MSMHMMMDVESLSVGSFPALLSYSAILFDPFGEEIEVPQIDLTSPLPIQNDLGRYFQVFHVNISAESCIKRYGADFSQDTLVWWFNNTSDWLRRQITQDPYPIDSALNNIVEWLYSQERLGKISGFWSHGSAFDIAIMKQYYEKQESLSRSPFHYRKTYDTRTIFMQAYGVDDKDEPNLPPALIELKDSGTQHHSLLDCVYQAKAVQHALKTIRSNGIKR